MKKKNILLCISLLSILAVGVSVPDGDTKNAGVQENEMVQDDVTAQESVTVQDSVEVQDDTGVQENIEVQESVEHDTPTDAAVTLDNIPAYSGEPFVIMNGNIPDFEAADDTTESFELYSELDELGRCGVAYANIGTDMMPTEERGEIGHIKPSGWQLVKYDCVDGKYLYNRCHLIAYQLAGENDNERNLITGTRYLNMEGMLPFENQVADYVTETGNHVLYRVTPIYEGTNPLVSGVQMEAWSMEDNGEGICFNVYVYNHQPGIVIDYTTGESYFDAEAYEQYLARDAKYILNKNTMKFHNPSCESVGKIKEKNKSKSNADREELILVGYDPCGGCNP